jgi:hypothetical protein
MYFFSFPAVAQSIKIPLNTNNATITILIANCFTRCQFDSGKRIDAKTSGKKKS